jgi:hypothetical protein
VDASPLKAIGRALVIGFVLVVGAGITAEVLRFQGHALAWADTFSLSVEANVPTWYSSMLLAACALALAASSRSAEPRWRWHWRGLAVFFVAMSLDEVASFHERLNALASLHGPLYFAWVIPFSVVVLVVGVLCLPFLRALPSPTRRRFIVAGIFYVGGALGVELVLGAWTSEHGAANLTYRMIDCVEEAGEIAGASLFLWSILARLWRG